jgi:hypothetical protein
MEKGNAMSLDMGNDKNNPADREAYCETVASQEEIYLEETEEELRAILISEDPSPSANNSLVFGEICEEREIDREVEGSMTDAGDNPRTAENLDEQLNHAAEELITGDSDDPPLTEDAGGDA